MAQIARRRLRSGRFGSEKGAELVEFALVLPFLLLVVLGIAEFGIMLQRYEAITNAAREGARVAVLPGYTTADVQARVSQYLSSGRVPTTAAAGGSPANPVVAVTDQSLVVTNGASSTTIPLKRVTVTYTYSYMFLPKMGTWFGRSYPALTLSAVAEMRTEAGLPSS
jgi:Flp pilus assembly protein TadG